MSDWNEAKLETLEDAYDSGEITSSDLADSRGLTLHAASTRLKRYHRQGLFTRTKIDKQYVYDLTIKGIARIDWLRKQKATKEIYRTITAKRCPVENPRTLDPQDSVDLDEDDNDEDEYDVTDEYDNIQEDILDETVLFLKNIQRCKVNREENNSTDAEDIEEDENIEDIFERLSQQRCKVNNDNPD